MSGYNATMGRGTNNGGSRRLDVRLSHETSDYLEGLAKLGVHGTTAAEVVRHFIRLGIEAVARDEEVPRILRDQDMLKGL